MDLFEIFIATCAVFLVLCILVPIVQAIAKNAKANAQQREKERRQAERDRIETEKRQQRERQQAERERVAAEKRAKREQEQAARLEAARQLAEYRQVAVKAAKELRELDREADTHGEADETIQTEPPKPAEPEAQRPANIPSHGNRAFTGQVVSFTGTLPGMKRREAIAAVEANGGKAYADMPAGTTLLVVGDKPGMNKLDKADKWIGQVRKITPAQFKAMLDRPITLTPDEFAAQFAPCA